MAIDDKHSEYTGAAPKWQRCRAAIAGQDAVHAGGELYLPKLKEQTKEEYAAYKLRASYFNATGRTLEGLVGMVFRKAPEIEAPTAMQGIIDDIDLKGTPLKNLAMKVLDEVLGVGRVGILVEYPVVTDQPANAATAAQLNLRPYAAVYSAETIINWKAARINNVYQPVDVRLAETYEDESGKTQEQVRRLMLNEGGIYVQQIWRKTEATGDWVQIDGDITPLMRSQPMREIPFWVFGPKENELCVQDSPLLDLVDINLAHYRVTADYEHGCHFTGLPMLFLAGVELEDNAKIYLGSQTAVTANNPAADGKYIEFTGQGLKALENNLDRKEKQMAAIGARMLEQQKNGVESEGAMQMRSNGETSVLASIANLTSMGLTAMLQFMAQWEGVSGECKIHLNTDYMPVGMTAQELKELVAAWQSGAISKQTLFENLKRGEVISENRTFEDEEEFIADEGAPSGNDE